MKWSVLVLCALGAVGWVAGAPGTTSARNRRSTFLNIVGEKPSESYPAPVLPVELPIKLGGYGGVNLPVLVLPVPVFTKSDTCEVNNNKEVPVEHGKARPTLPYVETRQQFKEVPNPPTVSQPIPYYPEPLSHKPVNNYGPLSTRSPPHLPKDKVYYQTSPAQIQRPNVYYHQPAQPTVYQPQPSYIPQPVHNEVEPTPEEQPIPYSQGRDQLFANSDDLIQSYRQQYSGQPGAPAVVPIGRRLPARIPSAGSDAPREYTVPGPEPPRPNFEWSLRLRIDLTVPRAGYTEAYEIEWDAKSNTARTVVEDGSTIIYRVPLLDGRIQFLEMTVDGTNGSAVRRCTMSPMLSASPDDRRFPGVPDLDSFHFVGYTSAEGRSRVELWRNVVIGKPGEGGAAPGESLNFTHQMFVYRDGGDAVPLKYTVKQSSSVLGPAIDGYMHRYQLLSAPTGPILPHATEECDVIVQLEEEKHRQRRQLEDFVTGASNLISAAWNSRFNPLKSFLGPTTDPSYDSDFNDYKDKFQRSYRDDKEQSVRKSQFINTKRFVNAANRVATSFKTAVNFMSDRVVEEIQWRFGVAPEPEETPPGLAPPDISYSEILKISATLPDDFDKWREDGGVSPVQDQKHCMSCWAFAVAGSTEGALFKKTKKLVPLSTQSLIDCGAEYKMNGCAESWPMYGFSYIKDRGIPAWEEYDYKAEVHECKKIEPVTRISGYRNVSNTLEGIKVAIFKNAPTVVIIGANLNSFKNYDGSGVYDDAMCTGHQHAVLAVGWGSQGGSHLILKNSWGTHWGKDGYILINPDVCSVTDRPSYAIVEKADILRDDLRSIAQDR